MILGIGSDLVDIRRIKKALERFGERFEQRIFTSAELQKAYLRPLAHAATLAKRFAAKEACVKALGVGFMQGINWREMNVINLPNGKPSLELTGKAAAHLHALTPPGKKAQIDLSMSDEYPYAQAFVVISAI